MKTQTTYRTLNLRNTDFELLEQLSELVANRYGKVQNGELVATLIKREIQTLTADATKK